MSKQTNAVIHITVDDGPDPYNDIHGRIINPNKPEEVTFDVGHLIANAPREVNSVSVKYYNRLRLNRFFSDTIRQRLFIHIKEIHNNHTRRYRDGTEYTFDTANTQSHIVASSAQLIHNLTVVLYTERDGALHPLSITSDMSYTMKLHFSTYRKQGEQPLQVMQPVENPSILQIVLTVGGIVLVTGVTVKAIAAVYRML